MARPMRIEYPGAVYHVTTRGNRRSMIFLEDEDDKTFLSILQEIVVRFHVLCHAYCLMGNHYHLVIETGEGNLSQAMKHLNGVYTQRFNKRHGKSGHVFQGRYNAILIKKSSHLLAACRYVVLNPVRAGLVTAPADWNWSSYKGTAGMQSAPGFLSTSWLLSQFSENPFEARARYIEFVSDMSAAKLWDDLVAGIALGDAAFALECRLLAHGDGDTGEIPAFERYAGRPVLPEILDGVGSNGEKWLKAVETFGYTQKEVAGYMGMHYSYISRVLNRERSKVKT